MTPYIDMTPLTMFFQILHHNIFNKKIRFDNKWIHVSATTDVLINEANTINFNRNSEYVVISCGRNCVKWAVHITSHTIINYFSSKQSNWTVIEIPGRGKRSSLHVCGMRYSSVIRKMLSARFGITASFNWISSGKRSHFLEETPSWSMSFWNPNN
jgi:hypothetical protein